MMTPEPEPVTNMEADSGASPAGSSGSTRPSDASLRPADIPLAEEEPEAQEAWDDELEAQEAWDDELDLPSTSSVRSSCCGSFRRSAVGLRMRGVASWPFRTPRRLKPRQMIAATARCAGRRPGR
jgi:hypothetical protein